MTHAIVTCCDSRYGNFLTQHWGRSLKENVDLRDVDVVVFDYGLTNEQRSAVESLGFQTKPGRRDGHVVNVRFRDIREWLAGTSYDQILSIDGGDVIFQADIRHLFDMNKDKFRGICEDVPVHSHGACMDTADFRPGAWDKIYEGIKSRPLINGGMFMGSRDKILGLFREFNELTNDFRCAGTDQQVLNYHFYKEGFVELAETYNFVLLTTRAKYSVQQGQFFDAHGKLIHVVHNAGMRFRMIKDFGYGCEFNRRKKRVVAAGSSIWFSLPIGVRQHLAEWRRKRKARKAALRQSAKALPQ